MKKKLKQPIFDDPKRYIKYQETMYDTLTIMRGSDFGDLDVRNFEVIKRDEAYTYDPYNYVGFRIVRNR